MRRATLTIALIMFAGPVSGQCLTETDTFGRDVPAHAAGFGQAIAADERFALIGSTRAEGRVDILDLESAVVVGTLTASDADVNDHFGAAVDIQDGLVLVGAPQNRTLFTASGAAYIFDLETGAEIHRLLPVVPQSLSRLGCSVDLESGRAVVGAFYEEQRGSLYVFDAHSGVLLNRIRPDDVGVDDHFAQTVSAEGDLAVVGAPRDSDLNHHAGSAYIVNVSTGETLHKLLAPSPSTYAYFGTDVRLHNGLAFVAAPKALDPESREAGAVFVFDAATGALVDTILPPSGQVGTGFGSSIHADGGRIIVGAVSDSDRAAQAGAAYVFDIQTRRLLAKLTSSEAGHDQRLGLEVFLRDDTALVGAPDMSDQDVYQSGRAYLFHLPDGSCPADLNNDGLLNFSDIALYLARYNLADDTADFASACGRITPDDLFAYIDLYLTGCP